MTPSPERSGIPSTKATKGCHVKLTIYNILGQRVITLVDEKQEAGNKSVRWDSRDQYGNEVATGIYFYRIHAGALQKQNG